MSERAVEANSAVRILTLSYTIVVTRISFKYDILGA